MSSPSSSAMPVRPSRFYEASVDRAGGIPRLVLRVPRLNTSFRFTYAFHAREVRFETDHGDGFRSAFPETFSFHAQRHDPTELYLRFEDLWANPARLAPGANRRDGEEMVLRLFEVLPGYLEGLLDHLVERGEDAPVVRASEDVAVFALIVQRFIDDKQLADRSRLRTSGQHLRRLCLRALQTLMDARVQPEYIERLTNGEVEPVRVPRPPRPGLLLRPGRDRRRAHRCHSSPPPPSAPSTAGSRTSVSTRRIAPSRARAAPFGDRESEVMRVVALEGVGPAGALERSLPVPAPPAHRDTLRLLKKLETWLLRQYDIRDASAVMEHSARLEARPHP